MTPRLAGGRPLDRVDVPPTAFELATGLLYGTCPRPAPWDTAVEPRVALESLIRPALAREPCMIAFSGGRDSSVLLAVAVALARREGWPEPIPVTMRFPAAATDEREWQERLMAHLRLEDWTRIDLVDELDLVGPVAVEGLRRHGLMFPANTHFIVPMARAAAGGSLLTGVGGDDVFGTWEWQDVGSLFAGRRGPRLGDAKRLAHAFAPRRLRGEVLRRRLPLRLPWLRPEVRSQAGLRIAVEMSAPQTWSARMLWSARWRPWRATARNLALLAADHGATVGSPFLEPAFLAALAGAGGRWGWGGRADTMRALFGDLVPEWLISRRGKAEFSEPLFGTHTRRFAQEWDGRSGLDPSLVDGEVLKAVWCAHQPHFLSAMAAQAAWLATYGEAGTRVDARTGALLSAP